MAETLNIDSEIENLEREVEAAKKRVVEARLRRPAEPVSDYELTSADGPVKLSELFGDKQDLLLIHNMGTGCNYCTLWADGFIGILPHLSDRAAVALISPDSPDVQKRFAEKRGWKFKMVSAQGSDINRDLGFHTVEGDWAGPQPGVSAFKKDASGQIFRTGKAQFGPGDDFCAVWPFLELFEGQGKGWQPKYFY
jgi:predicted dithiol-disulfide oxidoreductase (DUF899 family)